MISKEKILGYTFLLFSLFPIIPNRFKGVPVILFFLVAIYLFSRFKSRAINFKKTLVLTSLYIILLISLSYTENLDSIDKTLSTRLSLLILPISFSLIDATKVFIQSKYIEKFYKVFTLSTFLYCLIVFYEILSVGYYSDKTTISEVYNILNTSFYGINQHPIYSSIFIVFALYFLLFKIKSSTVYYRVLRFLVLLFFTYILFFLSRRGVLIALFIGLIASLFFRFKKVDIKKNLIIGFTFLFVISLFTPVVEKRFSEVFSKKTFSKVDSNNSSSIRYAIYECALKTIKQNWWFGFGVGDVKDELLKCYSLKSNILVEGNYNSHNQYFSYLLSSGIFGLLLLIFILVKTFLIGLKNKSSTIVFFTLFYVVVLSFENILERQSGVILFMFFISYFNFKDSLNAKS